MKTLAEFLESLEKDKAWRRKEIMAVSINVKSPSRGISEKTLIRSGVPLVYAHWEGYVKFCTKAYLEYLSNQNENAQKLSSTVLAIAYKSKLITASEERSTKKLAQLIDDFRSPGVISTFKMSSSLITESNLKWDVFCKILESLGINFEEYSTKSNFIDEVLLKNRNSIAHGEFLLVSKASFVDICSTVAELIDSICVNFSFLAMNKKHLLEARKRGAIFS